MVIVYAAIVTVLVGIGSFFAGMQYGAKDCVADREQKNAEVKTAAAVDQAKTEKRSGKRAAERARDQAVVAPIVKEIEIHVLETPAAPADCRTAPEQLRRLNALIDAANGAGGVRAAGAEAEEPRDGHARGEGPVDRGHGAQVPGAPQKLRMPAAVGEGR